MFKNVELSDLKNLFVNDIPLIDVRAPVEYATGSLPGSVNLPLMSDAERAAVGTTYKQQGREAAISLGYELVSGTVKDARLQLWMQHIQAKPEAVLYCFRGGLRSQITQAWLREQGFDRPLIVGGYKAARQWLRDALEIQSLQQSIVLLSGPTGSAKTHILEEAAAFFPVLNLEKMARHRGSAFGKLREAQPCQVDFENALSLAMLKREDRFLKLPWLIEDESRLIGRCAIPEMLFLYMRSAELIYVETEFEERVENVFKDYILNSPIGKGQIEEAHEQFAGFRTSLLQISTKLGGLRYKELLGDLEQSAHAFATDRDTESNKIWIRKLLEYYYDPMYRQSWEKRNPKVKFRGTRSAVTEYLQNLSQLN